MTTAVQIRSKYVFIVLFLLLVPSDKCTSQSADVIVTVNAQSVINPNAKLLLGITYDARSSMRSVSGPVGYHDTNGVMLPGIQSLFGDFPMSTLRYPANAVSFGFNWKDAVGPAAQRKPQNIIGIGPAQPLKFGFDEFIAMAKSHGTEPGDIQIMVTIYSKASAGLTSLQAAAAIDDPALSAADWVEYANAPNNGSNWGGGIDWAAKRDTNGHPAPYGIKIWNLGNEPWAPGEFGNDTAAATKYVATILPIIDSMKRRDSTIKITIPATGPITSQWNTTVMNHPQLRGMIYGLSPHFFPEETVMNGTIPSGVAKVESALPAMAETTKAKGLKLIVGDYAHGIPIANGAPTGDPNLAMQWQGANLSADFLLLISQQHNIERANFWAYGLPLGTWHPIRLNSPGNYTLMPAGVLYKKLFPLFLDKSVSVKTTSPKGSDGNSYSVRAGAFIAADSSAVNVIAVNRDKNDIHIISVNGLSGYVFQDARMLSAAGLTSDLIDDQPITADGSGNVTMPPMSIVILQYKKSVATAIVKTGNAPAEFSLLQNYPNPFNPATSITYQLSTEGMTTLKVYDAIGRETATLVNETKAPGRYSVQFDGAAFSSGLYFARLHSGTKVGTIKMALFK